MKPIEELAKECGVKLMPLSSKGGGVDYVKRNNEALRQAIIKDFVESQKPVYWRWGDPKSNVWIDADEEPEINHGNYVVQALYSLEEWK